MEKMPNPLGGKASMGATGETVFGGVVDWKFALPDVAEVAAAGC